MKMHKINTLLLCTMLIFFSCLKKTHKRITVEGYYYNGSTGEIMSSKNVFLNERVFVSGSSKTDRCSGLTGSEIDATTTNVKGYFCFFWKKLYSSACCYNTIDFQGLTDNSKYTPGIVVNLGENKFSVNYHRIFSGGIKLNFKNFSFTNDSIDVTITHIGHSAPKNLKGLDGDTYSVSSSGGFDYLSNALIFDNIKDEITANYYGMGNYTYNIKATRKSDGFKLKTTQTVFVNENELKEIDI
jgi:hypothetical protein